MSLPAGTRIGIYEVLGSLGAGGMGEVYRARDPKLGREVALKILPTAFAGDAERRVRLEREARTLASLNHPHIAHIHGFEDSGDTCALVMELVEGEDLAERIARGAIPVDEALPIARQIAEALEAAHEQGVIHRDLKPANVKLRSDGVVKVLDFGLAKALDQAPGVSRQASENMLNSPTIASPAAMTMRGMVLGTAGYMAPEQAKGKPVDTRADIWAFGVVLHEMLTGRRLFERDSVSETIAAVLTQDVDASALPADLPDEVRRLVVRCLERDVRVRLRDIGEARVSLERSRLAHGAARDLPEPPLDAPGPVARAVRVLPWLATAVLLTALAGSWLLPRPPGGGGPSIRLDVQFGPHASALTLAGRNIAPSTVISPDGAVVAFVGQHVTQGRPDTRLFVRRLDALAAHSLPGTEGASLPFFSADGQWLAFFAAGKLKKIAVQGGAAIVLADAPDARGGAWGADDALVFSPNPQSPLLRVPAAGGSAVPITTLDAGEHEITHRFPQVVDEGRLLLYTAHDRTLDYGQASIVVQALPSGARKVIQRGGYHGRYLASGHLTYIHAGTLFAVRFDIKGLEAHGAGVPVIESIDTATVNGGAEYAVSDTGVLLYRPGAWTDTRQLELRAASGVATPLKQLRGARGPLRFSPDGERLALTLADPGAPSDIWVYQWQRDTLTRLSTYGDTDAHAVWAPDGLSVAYNAWQADVSSVNLVWQRADGVGEPKRLTRSAGSHYPDSWHPSGRYIAFGELLKTTGWDLMILPVVGDGTGGWVPGRVEPFANTPFNENEAAFSPDGRWLAYTSDESGTPEIYVRAFPAAGARQRISTGGGRFVSWVQGRAEILYRGLDDTAVIMPFAVRDGALVLGTPRKWLTFPRNESIGSEVALHPDGERFAVLAPVADSSAADRTRLILTTNFFDELRRLAPRR